MNFQQNDQKTVFIPESSRIASSAGSSLSASFNLNDFNIFLHNASHGASEDAAASAKHSKQTSAIGISSRNDLASCRVDSSVQGFDHLCPERRGETGEHGNELGVVVRDSLLHSCSPRVNLWRTFLLAQKHSSKYTVQRPAA